MIVNNRHTSRETSQPTGEQTVYPNCKWPISRFSLDALVDLGMTDASIAHYYEVSSHEVAALRRRYAGGSEPNCC